MGVALSATRYGNRVLMRAENLAAPMKTMGYRDVMTAIHYQRPELEIVRAIPAIESSPATRFSLITIEKFLWIDELKDAPHLYGHWFRLYLKP